ncbi:MAG: HlyC/CorC family transporter [Rhodocyclaceae bacterium]|nr:HlyC/CorC family transporter [Rhodocyclaceae bacterium]MBX3670338.1 HlyC/CorC family transporter [Rhodocyclaceae bacterium]
MDAIPLSALIWALVVLLALSGFFSGAETAMMACNRYRLQVAAQRGERGPRLAHELLQKTDKLLGVILLFNSLVNSAAATLAGVITIQWLGEEKWALGAATLAVTFLILVFSEISPKVVGASRADMLAPKVAYVLAPLLRVFYPVIWFVNLFVMALLRVLRLKPRDDAEHRTLSPEELRALVLESSHFIPASHRSILVNLFDLEGVTMRDVMTPRHAVEAIDMQAPLDDIRQQIATSYHTRLPVYDGDLNAVLGVLHQRRVVSALSAGELDKEDLRGLLVAPYFIPGGTALYTQLQYFQEARQRIALVVDEYGEVEGLVTLEDIIEEIIGKFTTSTPGTRLSLVWNDDGEAIVDGGASLREINRALGLNLPLDGPKTLNGLILEQLQDIPESGVSCKIAGVPIEVLQAQNRMVRRARILRPRVAA